MYNNGNESPTKKTLNLIESQVDNSLKEMREAIDKLREQQD